MTGTYPDIPAPRIEYDRDGSKVFYDNNAGAISAVTAASVTALADESAGAATPQLGLGRRFAVMLSAKTDLAGFFVAADCDVMLETSSDTTSLLDGTWSPLAATYTPPTQTIPAYRTSIVLASASGVRAVRLTDESVSVYAGHIYAWHLYGQPSAGQAIDTLAIWDQTADEPLGAAALDWGDTLQGSSATRQFRIKNLSATKTASGITVLMQALTDAAPTVVSQHELSPDGVTFTVASTPLSVADLSAGAISPVIYLARNLSGSAQLGPWRQRLVAAATSWA
ncbi:MAG TPA: hypothetical protein VN088_16290 [Nocardioides sp.]|nr:hypothetical protein [Nocardioides sp.]